MPDLDALGSLFETWSPETHEEFKKQVLGILERYGKDFYSAGTPKELSRGSILLELPFSFLEVTDAGEEAYLDEIAPGLVISHPCSLEEDQGLGNDTAYVAPIYPLVASDFERDIGEIRRGLVYSIFPLPPTGDHAERFADLSKMLPLPTPLLRREFEKQPEADQLELGVEVTLLLTIKVAQLLARQ